MIREVHVENYKSILDLTLNLGRLTVLIGANGSGKSNLLEAIALASAAAQDKLDNEFLVSRGIRVTETRFMRSALSNAGESHRSKRRSSRKDDKPNIEGIITSDQVIQISIKGDDQIAFDCDLYADEAASYPKWQAWRRLPTIPMQELVSGLRAAGIAPGTPVTPDVVEQIYAEVASRLSARSAGTLPGFLIYSPENSSLRTFQSEGQILPLGIRGEGLFAHLKGLESGIHKVRLERIKNELRLIEWFETFVIPDNLSSGQRMIKIQDRYLSEGTLFDQRSANEGFLFLLFYLTLLISPETPVFFAIDNVDSSLNPKLCIALMQQIARLANELGKQVILTTHSPAILDGLDLNDEQQILLVVDRDKDGHTRTRRVDPPKPSVGELPVSLSEAFMRGYIGGLPKNF